VRVESWAVLRGLRNAGTGFQQEVPNACT
jgi:hypothetical protein